MRFLKCIAMLALVGAGCSVVGSDAGLGGAGSAHPCAIAGVENAAPDDYSRPDPNNDPGCPGTLGDFRCAADGTTCTFEISCQSGLITFRPECRWGIWNPLYTPCELPYDACPLLDVTCQRYTDGTWSWTGVGGAEDPPMCPWDRPAEGSSCRLGFWGGAGCGFWCDESRTTWTIAACTPVANATDSFQGTWVYDDACRPDCR